MHFRFKPDVPGSLEACSGGGQYGLTVTEQGDWLTCTNSQHIRHIVLPDHYLKRNPHLAVPAVTADIADHGAACRVFRISPFEAWRVERTTRRAGSDDAKRFPTTELVPGGYVTSGSGICVWLPGVRLFRQSPFDGHIFVCDPANNLIHRDVLKPSGSTFRAERHDQDCEFLASTDTWFRPVFLANGPGSALHVADFYREIIETPLSLPDDIKVRWNLNSRERGRIWRIRPKAGQAPARPRPSLESMTNKELVNILLYGMGRGWDLNTAHRLLVERGPDPVVVKRLETIAGARDREWRHMERVKLRALWLLHAWGLMRPEYLGDALELRQPAVMIQALQLAEKLKTVEKPLEEQILQLVNHPHSHVRFQVALSLGSLQFSDPQSRVPSIIALASHPDCDTWQQTALLSSVRGVEQKVLAAALREARVPTAFVGRLAGVVGKAVAADVLIGDQDVSQALAGDWTEREIALLRGLGAGYVQGQPALVTRIIKQLQDATTEAQRAARVGLLGLVKFEDAEGTLKTYLQPQQSPELQQAALRALAAHADRRLPGLIFENWAGWGPAVRREAQEVLFSRAMYLEQLLKTAEAGKFPLRQLDSTRREHLTRHSNAKIREAAKRLLAAQVTSRGEVVKKYQAALELTADVARGKVLFAKHCSTCHKFDGQGHEVAPDLQSALGNKTKEALLIDLLDPNREVDSRFVNYVITTTQGRTLTGMIGSESAQSVTLKRAEGVEETCLRSDIEEIQGTSKSLMPENFEEQLSPQDVADLLGYLLSARSRK
jgi:putative heme-binding domain-containing protein